LTLLNSDEVMAAAEATTGRLFQEAGTDTERIQRAFRLVLGRAATARELKMCRDFLQSCRQREEGEGSEFKANRPASAAPKKSWTELCRALFNLNAFVYVD
jgi:hypothetical protein